MGKGAYMFAVRAHGPAENACKPLYFLTEAQRTQRKFCLFQQIRCVLRASV